MSVSMVGGLSHILWKKMFQTTNQAIFVGNHSFLLEQHHLLINMLEMKRIGTIPCPLSSLLIFGG